VTCDVTGVEDASGADGWMSLHIKVYYGDGKWWSFDRDASPEAAAKLQDLLKIKVPDDIKP
jgi:hypothetical protein